MKKNVAGQKIGAQLVSATDGSAFTGAVTVSVTVDAGTQATGSVGSGACTHEGNGYHTYAPAQAETNGDLVAFTFTGTGAVPVTVQVYTRPTTGLLAPTVADRTLDVSATGEAGIDWANVGSPSTSVNLSATTINLVNTATTVTNQLTAAQIATGVWQDTTAGDFTVASSIGKALYINNVAPGGSGGLLISGSNSGTTTFGALTVTGATTLTGNVSMAAGLNITQSSSNTSALVITGNGTGHGIIATSGSGATGDGVRCVSAATNGNALNLVGVGTGAGLLATGGATGHGISGVGGATSGNGMRLAGTAGNSIAFNILGQGSAAGMSCTGGATGAGAAFIGGATSGNAISTSVTSGNLYINANVTHYNGTAGTFASGRPEVNTTHIAGSAVSTSTAQIGVNVVNAGGTAWASGSLTSGVFAAGAINAAAIAADAIGASELAADAVAEIADAVWDEVLSGHLTAGSTGNALNAAGSAGDPWSTSLPGAYGAGSAGYIVGTNIDALISSRMATYTQPTGFLAATFPTTVASTTNITAGTITTATNVTTVNGLAANVITAASIATDAGVEIAAAVWDEDATGHQTLGTFGKAIGDPGASNETIWNLTYTYLDGSVADAIAAGNNAPALVWAEASRTLTGTQAFNLTGNITGNLSGSVGSVTGTIGGLSAAALADFFDTNSGTTYASAVAGSVVKEIADNAGGSGLTAGAIADAVWDEAISGHLTSGTTGAKLNSAASAGDPWSTSLPGSYTGTEAGFILGTLKASTFAVTFPTVSEDNSIELVIGDDYYAADSRNLSFSYGASPSLSGATVKFKIQLKDTDTGYTTSNTFTSTTGTVSGSNPQVVSFDIPGTTTDDLSEGWHDYEVEATLSSTRVVTLTRGRVNMLSQVV